MPALAVDLPAQVVAGATEGALVAVTGATPGSTVAVALQQTVGGAFRADGTIIVLPDGTGSKTIDVKFENRCEKALIVTDGVSSAGDPIGPCVTSVRVI
jgi:hypothetical protein